MLNVEQVCKLETSEAVWGQLNNLCKMIYDSLIFVVSGQESYCMCDWLSSSS